jgi:putative flippase GtrA
LCSPGDRLLGQGIRFVIAGGSVALLYITVTTILSDVLGLPFEAALVIGFITSICAHFTLQRYFVWVHRVDFALSVRMQALRYMVLAGCQYALTAASTAVLPGALHVHVEIVYLATVAAVTPTAFILFRHGIFHPQAAKDHPEVPESPPFPMG